MPSDWPTPEQIGDVMEDFGLEPPSDATIQLFIDAAIDEIERRTGFKPFKGEEEDADYFFDPPGSNGILDLRGGFIEITEIAVNVTCDDEDGDVLEECEDWLAYPLNARQKDRPFTEVRFRRSTGTLPKSIKVTGKMGWDDEIPNDIFLAVLGLGQFLTAANALSTGAFNKIKQGQVEIQTGTSSSTSERVGAIQQIIGQWSLSIDKIVQRYLRFTV